MLKYLFGDIIGIFKSKVETKRLESDEFKERLKVWYEMCDFYEKGINNLKTEIEKKYDIKAEIKTELRNLEKYIFQMKIKHGC